MDVAKYIGFFLLKNEQCYINGLGTLQLLRKAATYDGQHLNAASHEIVMVPGGNVDESLANYIATNEQISITKASNALKDFSAETKSMLQAGNIVELPHLGKFTAQDGRIGFITAPQLQYKAAPIAAKKGVSLQHNERPPIPGKSFQLPTAPVGSKMPVGTPPGAEAQAPPPYMAHQPERKERLNWARIIFVLLLLVVMIGGAYYAYVRYIAPPVRKTTPSLTMPEMVDEPNSGSGQEMNTMPAMDEANTETGSDQVSDAGNEQTTATTNNQPTQQEQAPARQREQPQQSAATPNTQPANTPPPVTASGGRKINVDLIVNTFDKKDDAYRRKRALEANGSRAKVIEEDVDYYFVAIPFNVSPSDTARIRDSLDKVFNTNTFVY